MTDPAPEDKAVEAITALGGTITRDEKAAGKPVIAVSFASTGITNEGLKVLKELKHLQSLNLHRSYRINGRKCCCVDSVPHPPR